MGPVGVAVAHLLHAAAAGFADNGNDGWCAGNKGAAGGIQKKTLHIKNQHSTMLGN